MASEFCPENSYQLLVFMIAEVKDHVSTLLGGREAQFPCQHSGGF